MTVVINYGVAQDPIEPRHDFFVLNCGPVLQSTSKGRLQNIFGGRPGLDAPFQKREKPAVSFYQPRNCFRGQGLGRVLFSTHPARLTRREPHCKVWSRCTSAPMKAREALKNKIRENKHVASDEKHLEARQQGQLLRYL